MDSLLEKLRAAAPQARDQRDRRRRARLKERHQVRVASGQKLSGLQDLEADAEGEGESPNAGDESELLNPQDEASNAGNDSQVSEGEDIADRAANLLQGLRSNMDGDEERARRRRESAEDERRARRMRVRSRNAATSGSKDGADGSLPTVLEPTLSDEGGNATSIRPPEHESSRPLPTPAIVVSETADHDGNDAMDGSSPDKAVEISD
jgi:cytokinesis protein